MRVIQVGSYGDTPSQNLSGTSRLPVVLKVCHSHMFSIGDRVDLDVLRG